MGTRAHLTTYAGTRPAGLRRLETMLRVLEDTDSELSTWRADTTLSRFNRQPVGAAWMAPSRLCQLFGELEAWHRETQRAFDPAIGALIDAWDLRGAGRVPDDGRLRQALARSGMARVKVDRGSCRLTRTADVWIDSGAFGKGEALDRIREAIGAGIAWLVDVGGQVAVGRAWPDDPPWRVGIAHPLERGRAVVEIGLRDGSLATSGGSERDLRVGDLRVGHVVDPRTGRPITRDFSVVVWHASGLVADVLSTALYVMGAEEGLRWARARDLAACYLAAGPEPAGGVAMRCSPAFIARFPDVVPISGPASGD